MSGYRSIDFYFVDTEELLKSAWISDLCTVYEFIDCARALGYLRQDCRLSEVAVVHRAMRLANEFVLSSADIAPSESILVVRSGPDVDSTSVYKLVKSGLTIPHAMATLRYTSDNLDLAKSFVGRVWHPRMVRDMLLREPRSLVEIVNLIGCNNRECAEHFIGSLLLNPACFARELALAFDCCCKNNDPYDVGPVFHTFALLLRIYHRRDCPFCSGCVFREHDMRRAQDHHMNGKAILESIQIDKVEQVRDAIRELRISVDAGFCPSLVLYAWCLELLCDRSDDYEIRLCLNAFDRAKCKFDDEYVQRLYRKLRKRHGTETSRPAKERKQVVIDKFLTVAASHGDSWAQEAIQHIQSIGRIPVHFVQKYLQESWDRIVAYIVAHGNKPRGTCDCIPEEQKHRESLDFDMWRKESMSTHDPFAMYVCGICLFYGYGAKRNVVRGLRYLRLGAEDGDPSAQLFVALILLGGEVACRDLEESARYMKMSADQGDAIAQHHYGMYLNEGKGVCQNLVESARYFKMSADQGNAHAQNNYAAFLSRGMGVPQNLEESARYFKMSADHGLAQAQYNYANCLSKGVGVPQSHEEAARYYKMSADQGLAKAQCVYAGCLSKGMGVPHNLEEAARYYKMSADQGLAMAQFSYAVCLSRGVGVSQSHEEATRYFKMSADQGFAQAQETYALRLWHGWGVCVNVEEAARYFKMSADQGLAQSQYNYAMCLSEGMGVRENLEESAGYLKKSADQGLAQAQYTYAMRLLNGEGVCVNVEEALRYLNMSAAQGNMSALLYMQNFLNKIRGRP